MMAEEEHLLQAILGLPQFLDCRDAECTALYHIDRGSISKIVELLCQHLQPRTPSSSTILAFQCILLADSFLATEKHQHKPPIGSSPTVPKADVLLHHSVEPAASNSQGTGHFV